MKSFKIAAFVALAGISVSSIGCMNKANNSETSTDPNHSAVLKESKVQKAVRSFEAPSDEVLYAAHEALNTSNRKGYKMTGEVHIHGEPSIAEIVFSKDGKTVEVDIVEGTKEVLAIEEEIKLANIPDDIKEKAESTGVDLMTCGIIQKAVYLSKGTSGYEFDDCEFSKIDIDIDADSLEVTTEENDATTRDR